MSDGPQWFGEPPICGYRQTFEIGASLHKEDSAFQAIEVFDSVPLGRMLVLDNAVQLTERDEFIYHEMLAHVPLITHPNPRRLLVVGGGDGGALRRGMEHGVEDGVLVEIDQRVVEVCKTFLPGVGWSALANSTSQLIVGDGVDYVSSHPKSCDVLLVDSTDPVGPAEALFGPSFLTSAYNCLTDDGIYVAQTGSPLLMSAELMRVQRAMRQIFPIVRTYLASIPSYPGVLWSFTLGSKRYDPISVDAEEADRRLRARRIVPQYYSPELHRACFALPQFLREALDEGKEPGIFGCQSSIPFQ